MSASTGTSSRSVAAPRRRGLAARRSRASQAGGACQASRSTASTTSAPSDATVWTSPCAAATRTASSRCARLRGRRGGPDEQQVGQHLVPHAAGLDGLERVDGEARVAGRQQDPRRLDRRTRTGRRPGRPSPGPRSRSPAASASEVPARASQDRAPGPDISVSTSSAAWPKARVGGFEVALVEPCLDQLQRAREARSAAPARCARPRARAAAGSASPAVAELAVRDRLGGERLGAQDRHVGDLGRRAHPGGDPQRIDRPSGECLAEGPGALERDPSFGRDAERPDHLACLSCRPRPTAPTARCRAR